jgi:hypothetical protein
VNSSSGAYVQVFRATTQGVRYDLVFAMARRWLTGEGCSNSVDLIRLKAMSAERAFEHIQLGTQKVHFDTQIVAQRFAGHEGDRAKLIVGIGIRDQQGLHPVIRVPGVI